MVVTCKLSKAEQRFFTSIEEPDTKTLQCLNKYRKLTLNLTGEQKPSNIWSENPARNRIIYKNTADINRLALDHRFTRSSNALWYRPTPSKYIDQFSSSYLWYYFVKFWLCFVFIRWVFFLFMWRWCKSLKWQWVCKKYVDTRHVYSTQKYSSSKKKSVGRNLLTNNCTQLLSRYSSKVNYNVIRSGSKTPTPTKINDIWKNRRSVTTFPQAQ